MEELSLPLCDAAFFDRGLAKLVAKQKITVSNVINFYLDDVLAAIIGDEVEIHREYIGLSSCTGCIQHSEYSTPLHRKAISELNLGILGAI